MTRRLLPLLLALLLAACGPQAAVPATPTPASPSTAVAASATPGSTQLPTPSPPPQPSQQPAAGWQRYEYAEAGLSVELPAAPEVQSDSTPTLIGPIGSFTATVQLSATQLLRVVATRYPRRLFELDDIGGLGALAAAREALLRDAPTRGLSERAALLGPFPGRELLVPPGADGFFLRARLFVVGSMLFQLELRDTAAPLDAADAQAAADRFFASLALVGSHSPVAQGWQAAALGDAFCSIWLPSEPAKTARPVKTGAGPLDRITYTAEQPERGLRLVVSATAYPPTALREDGAAERELDRARDSAILEMMGSQPSEAPTYYGSTEGRELRMATPDGGFAIVRLHMLGSVLYELTLRSSNALPAPAEGRPSVPSGDEVARFFLSFEAQ
jgi:hypothetical protein